MSRRQAALAAMFVALLPTLALAQNYQAGGVTVAHPWARATPGGATVGAAYVEITAKDADTLVAASSPGAARVEIHSHTMGDGVMKMRKLENLPIPVGGPVMLKPSGDHIMLLDLKAPLKQGDVLPITLVFEKAGKVTVEATVEPVGAMGPTQGDKPEGHQDHSGHQ